VSRQVEEKRSNRGDPPGTASLASDSKKQAGCQLLVGTDGTIRSRLLLENQHYDFRTQHYD